MLDNPDNRRCHPVDDRASYNETALDHRRDSLGDQLDDAGMLQGAHQHEQGDVKEDRPPIQCLENTFDTRIFHGKMFFEKLEKQNAAYRAPHSNETEHVAEERPEGHGDDRQDEDPAGDNRKGLVFDMVKRLLIHRERSDLGVLIHFQELPIEKTAGDDIGE